MRGIVLVLAAAVVASGASAQTAEDIQRLDRMSQERGRVVGHMRATPNGPKQDQPPAEQPQHVKGIRGMWECVATDENRPIRMRPDPAAPSIGLTSPLMASDHRRENGFVAVIAPNGNLGWLPERSVYMEDGRPRPWLDANNKPRRCTVKGRDVKTNAPVLEIR